MTSDKIPSRIVMPCPFGGFGNDNIVQIGSVSGTDMNYPDGFPSAYGAPTENNGKFVLRKEMNALGKAATNDLFYHKCGGLNTFDADFCAAVGGYPNGAVLQMVDGYSIRSVMSLVDNNKACFTGQTLTDAQKNAGLTNGSVDSVSWIYLNEKTDDFEIGTYNFSVLGEARLLTSFFAPRSGFVSFDVNAKSEVIQFPDIAISDSVIPSYIYTSASACLLIAEHSDNLSLPSFATSSWDPWKLVYGQCSSYDSASQKTRFTPISDFHLNAGTAYVILVAAGTGRTSISDSSASSKIRIISTKTLFEGTVKISLK